MTCKTGTGTPGLFSPYAIVNIFHLQNSILWLKMFSPSGRLFRIDQVPDHFREHFIMSGYRYPRSTASQCILSIFQLTNETVNIWTHLLPTLYFWWMTYCLWGNLNMYNDPYAYPMLCFMVSVCLFPTASCFAHIFNTMSDQARHICFFLDYCAINWYSFGAAIAFKAYVFPKGLIGSVFDNHYLTIAAVNAVAATAISCHTRFMSNGPSKKALRMIAFAVPYFHDVVPLMYRILLCQPGECQEGGLYLHTRQFLFAFGATILYGTHIPERFYPGRFDIFGHSHQIFHVLCVMATNDQTNALILDLNERREYLEENTDIPSYQGLALMIVVGAMNLITLLFYVRKLDQIIPVSPSLESASCQPVTDTAAKCYPTPKDGIVRDHSTNSLASLFHLFGSAKLKNCPKQN